MDCCVFDEERVATCGGLTFGQPGSTARRPPLTVLRESSSPILLQIKSPVLQAEAPVLQAKAPVLQANALLLEADALLHEADALLLEADALLLEADALLLKADALLHEADALLLEADALLLEADALLLKADSLRRLADSEREGVGELLSSSSADCAEQQAADESFGGGFEHWQRNLARSHEATKGFRGSGFNPSCLGGLREPFFIPSSLLNPSIFWLIAFCVEGQDRPRTKSRKHGRGVVVLMCGWHVGGIHVRLAAC